MTEEATFYDDAWSRFTQATEVRSAFADTAFANWTADRRYLSIVVDLSHVDFLAGKAAEIARAVDHPAYGLVASDGLHLTIQEIGISDTLAQSDMTALTHDIARVAAETTPFCVAVSGVGSFADAAFFQVEPWNPFRALLRTLQEASPLLRGRGRSADVAAQDGGFAPHISIAYYTTTAPSSVLAARLAPFRGLMLPPFEVTALGLIGTRRPTQPYFQWDVLARYSLDGRS